MDRPGFEPGVFPNLVLKSQGNTIPDFATGPSFFTTKFNVFSVFVFDKTWQYKYLALKNQKIKEL